MTPPEEPVGRPPLRTTPGLPANFSRMARPPIRPDIRARFARVRARAEQRLAEGTYAEWLRPNPRADKALALDASCWCGALANHRGRHRKVSSPPDDL